jgi:predicted nuclease of predicted toxin-antitoxin system
MSSVLIDECISADHIRQQLQSAGYKVNTLPQRTPDSEVAEYARIHDHILLSFDKDFLDKATYPVENYHGIFIFRRHNCGNEILAVFIQSVISFLKTNDVSGKSFVVRMKSGEPNVVEIVPPGTPRRPHPPGTKRKIDVSIDKTPESC